MILRLGYFSKSIFFVLITVFAFSKLANAQQQNQVKRQAETFKSWRVVCDDRQKDGKTIRACFMQQVIVLTSTKKPIFELAIDPPVQGKNSRAAAISPLGTLIPEGLTATLSGVDAFKLAIRHCDANGCWAFFDVNPQLLAALKAGNQVDFSM
ncbi:MAG: invasion associated locus B family protein [Hyphomicrobiales bacterium]